MRRTLFVLALLLGLVLVPATSAEAKRYAEPIGLFDGFKGTVTAYDLQGGVPHYVTFSGAGVSVVPGVGRVKVAGTVQLRGEPLPAGVTPFQKVGPVTGNSQKGWGWGTNPSTGAAILGFGFGSLTGVGWAKGLNPAASWMDGGIYWPTDLPGSGDYTWTTFEGGNEVGGYRFHLEF